jgi:hypothetical protein
MLKKILNGLLIFNILTIYNGCARKFAIASNGKSIKMEDSPSSIENFSMAVLPVLFITGYFIYANKCAETGNCK